jgi:hypothetical protein
LRSDKKSKRSIKLEYRPKQEQNNNSLFIHAEHKSFLIYCLLPLNLLKKETLSSLQILMVKATTECDSKCYRQWSRYGSEILPKLFAKFASKSFQGTGLGLFISKSIIEAYGGRIWAENNSGGKGVTFSFSLPITQM